MNSKHKRDAGILLHITSLPSPYGIGDLGRYAYRVADWMEKADIRLWQLLPLNPTGFGNSPYAPRSTFAGNELLLDLEVLQYEGFLSAEDLTALPSFPEHKVDFTAVQQYKLPLLKKAALAFLDAGKEKDTAFLCFCKEQSFWLDDYALFMVLYEKFQDARWFSHWPKEYAERDHKALQEFSASHAIEIATWKVLQYFFAIQWDAFKHYANEKQIKLVGDVPIFVAADSADTWSNMHLFKTDGEGHFSAVSGVPPDIFSATGQLWGNPVYDWKVLEKEEYQWWIKRLERLFTMIDILRIDHFRGFDAYYEIPAGDTTAERGTWVHVDGERFFRKVREYFGSVPIIAEDLGLLTDSVEELRDTNGFPGMKILQFGFSKDSEGKSNYYDDFLPHNWKDNFVAYTGTHDNNTTLGWFHALDTQDRKMVLTYLDCSEDMVVKKMIRTLMLSCARTAVIPMQDLLEKDEEARMNYPSTCNDVNWSWRASFDEFSDAIAEELAHLVTISARNGRLGI